MSVSENFEEPDSVEVPFFKIHPPVDQPYGPYYMNKNMNLANLDEKNQRILGEHEERLKMMKERFAAMGAAEKEANETTIPEMIHEKTKGLTDYLKGTWQRLLIVLAVSIMLIFGLRKLLGTAPVKKKLNNQVLEQQYAESRQNFFFNPPRDDTLFWRK